VTSTFYPTNDKEEQKQKACKGSEEKPQVADAYAISFSAKGLMYAM